jgi:hypothetical protein
MMRTHVRVTAWLFIAVGALFVITALASSVLFGGLAALIGSAPQDGSPIAAIAMGFTGVVLVIFLLAFAVPCIACGWGLLRLRPWARILGIVLAAIALLKFPVGTAFGVYALWVFFSRQTEPLFEPPAA